MSKFYLTTPIYYVNDKPHIGHAYTTIVADALARYHRLKGEEVRLTTGTDENSQKNIKAMEHEGETDLNKYLNKMADVWKSTWNDMDISCDDFIRTTEERHRVAVYVFWKAVQEKGDIELREYESWYCVGCEAFKTDFDIVEDRCPLHPNKPLERLKEKNYFFLLSRYKEKLLDLYQKEEKFVMPEERRNEIKNYVEHHLADISISRESKKLSVGIPVPGDDSQRIYVWFDALINYLSSAGYGSDEKAYKKWWPANLHLVGKDIIKFHCALWPGMLMSAGIEIPKQVFAHGFFTINGQKISKSLGNAIDPRDLADKYGMDALRYFLLREIPFGEDGDFNEDRLRERYTSDLANTFGNFVNRTISMSKKYFDGKVPEVKNKKIWQIDHETKEAIEKAYESNRCDHALEIIWKDIFRANKYVEETQPFKLIKIDPQKTADVLYALLEACRWYAWLVSPVMPTKSREIFSQLGLDTDQELKKEWDNALEWGGLKSGAPLGDPKPLFPPLA